MPRGVPTLGDGSTLNEELPGAEVLGELKTKPARLTTWDDPETKVQMALEEGPPPWEILEGPNASDARNFIECPKDWVLYWINPKLLDAWGWRGWTNVRAKDPRVNVLVPSMVTPEGQVRRGGPAGDILAYMPRHWYESRRKEYAQKVAAQTASSVERMEHMKDDFRRGVYGPNISLESAKHPSHTMADLRGVSD